MKRRILLIGLVIVLAVVSVGCGGGGGNNLDGRWETAGFHNVWVEFSGNNFTANNLFANHVHAGTSGTFSVQGDQIEFVGDNGRIAAHPFSQTENTITIGLNQFTRVS